MTSPRIALIHATPVAIEPIVSAFKQLWPDARTTNLLEDSLSADLAAEGRLTAEMIERFVNLARYVRGCGADAILFTCSAFGPAIEAARAPRRPRAQTERSDARRGARSGYAHRAHRDLRAESAGAQARARRPRPRAQRAAHHQEPRRARRARGAA